MITTHDSYEPDDCRVISPRVFAGLLRASNGICFMAALLENTNDEGGPIWNDYQAGEIVNIIRTLADSAVMGLEAETRSLANFIRNDSEMGGVELAKAMQAARTDR